jgi:Rrf2 family iron-sulfur cluster assembly transcriptional regulator
MLLLELCLPGVPVMLSQAVNHACAALGCVAAIGRPSLLVKEISESCDVPAAYLAKIINTLARKGIVRTQRGVGGGVSLARPPAEVSLYDICIALEDPAVAPRCLLGNAKCTEDRACPAHEFCTDYREGLARFLRKTTIADIAAFENRRRWRINQR